MGLGSFRTIVLGLVFVVGLSVAASADSATIRVPADQPTIQAGINAAAQGDLVLVAPGIYTGPGNRDVRFNGKIITVRSEGGANATIIDCQNLGNGFIFRDHETQNTILEGFTVKHAGAPGGLGGAILCRFECAPTITSCVVRDNSSGNGAGFCIIQGASPRISDCRILSNFTTFSGSGIYIDGGATEIMDCEIADNSASAEAACAGIFCVGESRVTIQRCTFRNNVVSGKGYLAGALYCGFGAHTVTDCTFIENKAGNGGGAACYGGEAVFTRCLFVDNRAEMWGGAIFVSFSQVRIENCTLVSNSAGLAGGGIYVDWGSVEARNSIFAFGTEGEAVVCDHGSSVELVCCDIYGNVGGDWTGCIATQAGVSGNLAADPLFCSMPGEDFHLDEASPCAPDHAGDCGLIGALEVGCGATAVAPTTWGRVKAAFGPGR